VAESWLITIFATALARPFPPVIVGDAKKRNGISYPPKKSGARAPPNRGVRKKISTKKFLYEKSYYFDDITEKSYYFDDITEKFYRKNITPKR